MRASTLWRIAAATLAVHTVAAILLWFELPERVPIHFGFSGSPDAWAPATPLSWFGLLAISLGTATFIRVLSYHGPLDLWSIPEKDRFLRMDPVRREPVLELLRWFGAFATICTTITMMAVHLGIYLTARGHTSGLTWQVGLAVALTTLVLLLGTIPWSKAVRRAILQGSAEP